MLDSVGVCELLEHLSGKMTLDQAEDQIATRTRRLARRQIRWFDKLTKILRAGPPSPSWKTPSRPICILCMI